MNAKYDLQRFLDAQERTFEQALKEVRNGRKTSHWMWFIFPQISGLGFSEMAIRYGIRDLHEARSFMDDPVLGKRLVKICEVLRKIKGRTANEIFDSPDDLKLRSCMTLFGLLPNANPVFDAILEQYFNGQKDSRTIELVKDHADGI
jgi:uncharacterized protein (DUF1810 family)